MNSPIEVALQALIFMYMDAHAARESLRPGLDRHIPQAWDLLVQAVANPEQPGSNGQAVWKFAQGTLLGDRYLAQRRAMQTQPLPTRSRHRP